MSRIFAASLIVLSTCVPLLAYAASQDLSVTPAVIDEKGKTRDILKETIHLTNTSDHLLDIYPRVDDTNVETGAEGFSRAHGSDELAKSFANWIELTRGVIELSPGEQRDVPFIIRIDPGAAPGTYHANISFSSGATRDEAEGRGAIAEVTVNLIVQDDVKEIMQINSFSSDNLVFTGDDVLFKYQLQNIGNRDEQPQGEVRIYDRKGHEVASVDVNKEGKTVAPDQTSQLASVWSAAQGFGKFKALLSVKYGSSQTASVEDVAYFWIIPWKQLAIMLSIAVVAALVLALYFHRWLEERHFGKLAAAGLLKAEALVHMPHLKRPSPAPAPSPSPASTPAQAMPASEKKKRKLLSFLRRKTQADASVPAAPAPVQEKPVPQAVSQGDHGSTIDLKSFGKDNSDEWNVEAVKRSANGEHGHVINLKDRS